MSVIPLAFNTSNNSHFFFVNNAGEINNICILYTLSLQYILILPVSNASVMGQMEGTLCLNIAG